MHPHSPSLSKIFTKKQFPQFFPLKRSKAEIKDKVKSGCNRGKQFLNPEIGAFFQFVSKYCYFNMDSTGFPFPNSYFTIRPSPKSPKKLFLAISLFTSNSFGPISRFIIISQWMITQMIDDDMIMTYSLLIPITSLPSPFLFNISPSFFIIFWVSIDDKNRKKDGEHLGSEHPYIGSRRPLFITFRSNSTILLA